MSQSGDHALRLVDKLLTERPDRVGQDFSAATRCLAAYRDELIGRWRSHQDAADRQRLEQVNSVLSVVLGGHYPLGPVPWPEIEQARVLLAGVLQGAAPEASMPEDGEASGTAWPPDR